MLQKGKARLRRAALSGDRSHFVCCQDSAIPMSYIMRKPVLPYANNKGADQSAHPRSLISAFVIRCLDSIIPLVSIYRNFKPLSSFRGCAGWFVSNLVTIPEDRFSRDEAHIYIYIYTNF